MKQGSGVDCIIVAVEFAELDPKLRGFFRERSILLRPLGNTVYVMPPYCIGEVDLDRVYAAISDAASWVRSAA
jgi:adenosylmethionine-8-amino-7-oxononanoate aminotransferase